MNVEITFTPDDQELLGVGQDAEPIVLFETTLVVSVRLRVADRELLAIHRKPEAVARAVGPEGSASWTTPVPLDVIGAPQPVIGFLCRTRDAIHRAATGQASEARLAFGWPSLFFDPVPDGLLAVRLGRGRPATAEVRDFEAAIDAFEGSVRTWIAGTAPDMQRHPGWPQWFGDDPS
jgi:hypothetical protein